MKKAFTAPSLKHHGALQEITQALGSSSAQDTIFVGGKSFPGSVLGLSGSSDAILIPKP
jgi:hypothetical protein